MKINHGIHLIILLYICMGIQLGYGQEKRILDSIFTVIEQQSIFSDKFDRQKYPLIAENSGQLSENTLMVLQDVLRDIGDRHGGVFFREKSFRGFPEEASQTDKSLLKYAMDEKFAFRTTLIDKKYGYIAIPSPQIPMHAFRDKEQAIHFISSMAQQIQDSICMLGNDSINDIILDLRLSLGGNLPLLLSSVRPLLSDGDVLDILWANGDSSVYHFKDDDLYEDDEIISSTKSRCHLSRAKIAVVIGNLTGSAAEQVALAFKGQQNIKYIGENTAGFSTMTKLLQFEELMFTYSAGVVQDRDKKLYYDHIVPDITIIGGDNFEDLASDQKIISAIEWFESLK